MIIVKRSTKEYFQAWREVKGATWFDRLHGYEYAKWPNLYFGIGLGEHPLRKHIDRIGDLLAILSPPPGASSSSLPSDFAGRSGGYSRCRA